MPEPPDEHDGHHHHHHADEVYTSWGVETPKKFTETALRRVLDEPGALARALGEYLSEPKANVSFEIAQDPLPEDGGVRLDARSIMLYDDAHVFMNGDSWHAADEDAEVLRRLADARHLDAAAVAAASPELRALLEQWCDDGWIHPLE